MKSVLFKSLLEAYLKCNISDTHKHQLCLCVLCITICKCTPVKHITVAVSQAIHCLFLNAWYQRKGGIYFCLETYEILSYHVCAESYEATCILVEYIVFCCSLCMWGLCLICLKICDLVLNGYFCCCKNLAKKEITGCFIVNVF